MTRDMTNQEATREMERQKRECQPLYKRVTFDPKAPKIISRREVWQAWDGVKYVTVMDFTTGVGEVKGEFA